MRIPAVLAMVRVLVLIGAAGAEPSPERLSPSQAADAALAAEREGDRAKLRELAAGSVADPWLVADELCRRGEHATALALAGAATHPEVAALPAYLRSRSGSAQEETARRALEVANQALVAKHWSAALDATGHANGPFNSVTAVRLAYGRGLALRGMGQLREAAGALLMAGRGARSLGWCSRARMALMLSGDLAWEAGEVEEANTAWEILLEVEREREDPPGIAFVLGNLALARERLGRWSAALEAYETAVELERAHGTALRLAVALCNFGDLLVRRGDYPKAIELLEEALALSRGIGDREGVALTLLNLGNVRVRTEDGPAAARNYREALAVFRELGDRAGIAKALGNLGVVRMGLEDYEGAIQKFEESLAIRQEIGDRSGAGEVLINLGDLHRLLGRRQAARLCLQESLAIYRDLEDMEGAACALGSLGIVLEELGEYPAAILHYRESLLIYRRLGARLQIAIGLSRLGDARRALGDFPEALEHYRESLAIQRQLGRREGTASALNDLGTMQEQLGDYTAAFRAYEEALKIYRNLEDPRGVASVQNNLGVLRQNLGDLPQALRIYEESLRMDREHGHLPGVVKSLFNLGSVRLVLGQFDEALVCFEQALALERKQGWKAGAAGTLNGIGVVREARGEPDRALACYEEALEIFRELGLRPDQASVLCNLAGALRKRGDYDRVRELLDEAVGCLENAIQPDSLARIYLGRSALELAQGRPAEAVKWARRSVSLVEGLSAGLAEGEGARTREGFVGLFDLAYRAAFRSGRVEDLLWFMEQGRSLSLRECLGSRSAIEAAVVPGDLRLALTLARHAERQAVGELQRAEREGNRALVLRAREARKKAQREVADLAASVEREAKAAAAVALCAPANLETVQGYLEAHETLVYFGLTSEETVALVVRRDAARIVELPGLKVLGEAVRRLLDDPRFVNPDQVSEVLPLLVEPLALGEDVERILISPSGWLSYVPWSLLIPEREVVLVPSGTVYGLLRKERGKRGELVLALGDPDYEQARDEVAVMVHRGRGPGRLLPLPATRAEVKAVADLGVLGADASETALPALLAREQRWRAVHFACHCLLDAERPRLSSLALSADTENDGFLSALEILRLRVPADLVVLSACETGAGSALFTESFIGLARVFMAAGAPRVICSLWEVEDSATRALMVKFYELWNPPEGEGLTAAAALRQAQEFVRSHEQWEHPYYWAAWVLWGLP